MCICPGAIYMSKIMRKNVENKSQFKEKFLKVATVSHNDRGYLLTKILPPVGYVFSPGNIHMHKLTKKKVKKKKKKIK